MHRQRPTPGVPTTPAAATAGHHPPLISPPRYALQELRARGVITGTPQRSDPAQRPLGSIVLDCTAGHVAALAEDPTSGDESLGGVGCRLPSYPVGRRAATVAAMTRLALGAPGPRRATATSGEPGRASTCGGRA